MRPERRDHLFRQSHLLYFELDTVKAPRLVIDGLDVPGHLLLIDISKRRRMELQPLKRPPDDFLFSRPVQAFRNAPDPLQAPGQTFVIPGLADPLLALRRDDAGNEFLKLVKLVRFKTLLYFIRQALYSCLDLCPYFSHLSIQTMVILDRGRRQLPVLIEIAPDLFQGCFHLFLTENEGVFKLLPQPLALSGTGQDYLHLVLIGFQSIDEIEQPDLLSQPFGLLQFWL